MLGVNACIREAKHNRKMCLVDLMTCGLSLFAVLTDINSP